MQDYLEGKLSSGEYASATDVLAEGLQLLMDRDSLYRVKLEELRKEIAIGVEQVEVGEAHCSVIPET
jgi:antitoxin ParD1/3/4